MSTNWSIEDFEDESEEEKINSVMAFTRKCESNSESDSWVIPKDMTLYW